MLVAAICGAGVQEAHGAAWVFESLHDDELPRLRLVWADAGYAFHTARSAAEVAGVELRVVPKKEGQKGFEPLPRRWVVERTFAWLMRYRRLRADYETTPESSCALVLLAMIHLMTRRLSRN